MQTDNKTENTVTEKEEPVKKNLTVFGQETEFDGELEFTDSLVITGKFKGKITSSGDLEIDKTAICNVDKIKVNSVVISGKVTGNIEAKERVEMCSGSRITGDVVTSRIRIADDVDFEGQVSMLEENTDIDLFSVASDEFKQALVIKSDMPH
jgi:cytoskeletal protein CcmA (bactofilin family)